MMKFSCFIALSALLSPSLGMTKVEAPNYKFNLEELLMFQPDKKMTELEAKFGKPEIVSESRGIRTQKFHISHPRCKFPVIIQTQDEVLLDSFARLPSYFSHDVFLQSLIDKLGKQTSYKKTGEEAYYVWEKDSLKHVYSAACTITCFPIFYSVEAKDPKAKSLLQKMKQ